MNRQNFKKATAINEKIEKLEKALEIFSAPVLYVSFNDAGEVILTPDPSKEVELTANVVTRTAPYIGQVKTGLENKIASLNAEFEALT